MYLEKVHLKSKKTIQILYNWLDKGKSEECSISIAKSALSGRKIFIYAGNMGIAQGVDVFLKLAERLKKRTDIGFIFVGRGSDAKNIYNYAKKDGSDNILFYDEIDSKEIPNLFAQCHVGIVSLDLRHKTHNIPGKFVAYMKYGLPVLAVVNAENDLVKMINEGKVGFVCTTTSLKFLETSALNLINEIDNGFDFRARCDVMSEKYFATDVAVRQIVEALTLDQG